MFGSNKTIFGSDKTTVITYDNSHRELVKSGADKIKEVFESGDKKIIREVLFCLDYYLDPYYNCRLPHENEVYELLQKLLITSDDDDIIDDCIQLIGDYCNNDINILMDGFDKIKESKQAEVRDMFHWGGWIH
jgi:hypothetical protein